MFGYGHEPWKNWEVATVFLTLIYTGWFYYNGFFGKKHFIKIKSTNRQANSELICGNLNNYR